MRHIRKTSDIRLDVHCIYCGSEPNTRDHVPSKVLLDEPYPVNLPVVPCCDKCNQSYSANELYLACLIECVLHGTTDPAILKREKIKRILTTNQKLRMELEDSIIKDDDQIYFQMDICRVDNVILKLALGHAAFENSELPMGSPKIFKVSVLSRMTNFERRKYFSTRINLMPEVGSRSFYRMLYEENFESWIVVQDSRYAYNYFHGKNGVTVRILLSNYLACEIVWD